MLLSWKSAGEPNTFISVLRQYLPSLGCCWNPIAFSIDRAPGLHSLGAATLELSLLICTFWWLWMILFQVLVVQLWISIFQERFYQPCFEFSYGRRPLFVEGVHWLGWECHTRPFCGFLCAKSRKFHLSAQTASLCVCVCVRAPVHNMHPATCLCHAYQNTQPGGMRGGGQLLLCSILWAGILRRKVEGIV